MKTLMLTLLGVLAINVRATEQQTWYTADQQVYCLPIVVPVGACEKAVYLSRTWGLSIESVICDGKPLVLARKGGIIDEMARYVVKVSGTYVYTCPASGLLFTSWVKSGDVADDVVAYEIPMRWSNLVMTFRTRFADGTLSDLREARFSRLSLSEMAQAVAEFGRSHRPKK
jgi:hypothetical protein